MADVFSQDQIAALYEGYRPLREKYQSLLESYVARKYKNPKAEEYATHGLSRRLGCLIRCVDRVFEVLPPERGDIPSRDEVMDATVNIQAFMFNVFGCLENLAWVWVFEKPVTREDGKPIGRRDIGLGEKCKSVRASFSPAFTAYLDSRKTWFEHIVDFRDALAHRIPLYIPPHTVHPDNAKRYAGIATEAFAALMARDR
jgi:hypothetical protein